MNATKALNAAQRVPLIKFIGKRSVPKSIDHSPSAHPASPTHSLPDSFANYRSKAQQHGPLGVTRSPSTASSSLAYGAIGGHTGHSLGKIDPPEGMFFDRSELPKRFGRTPWTQAEIEAIETGGASMWG
ncbi:hypothetical protein MMC30_007196 [Trapelia coarctata]|nr:hypothetical protein [Trapelia coarctata]